MSSRQSNIELLRIIAMTMVIVTHASDAMGPYCAYADNHSLFDLFRLFCEVACLVCVNSFVMISGWFGIRPSVKGIVSLFFQLCFYGILIALVYRLGGRADVTLKDTLVSCMGMSYWFIPAYLVLYALSPVLNTFLDHADRKEILTTLLLFFAFQILYGRFGDQGHFITEHSAISFVGLYLCAGYLKRYPHRISTLSAPAFLGIYLGLTLVLSLLAYFVPGPLLEGGHSVLHYNNPGIILSSIAFFLLFTRLEFQSRAVNFLASSAFAIYLIHMNYLVRDDFTALMQRISLAFPPYRAFGLMLAAVLLISLACILVDKLRIFLWKPAWKLVERWTSR